MEGLEDESDPAAAQRGALQVAERLVVSTPSSQYAPEVGRSSSPSVLSSVDFPEPDGPTIDRCSPRRTVRFTSRSACTGGSESKVRRTTTSSMTASARTRRRIGRVGCRGPLPGAPSLTGPPPRGRPAHASPAGVTSTRPSAESPTVTATSALRRAQDLHPGLSVCRGVDRGDGRDQHLPSEEPTLMVTLTDPPAFRDNCPDESEIRNGTGAEAPAPPAPAVVDWPSVFVSSPGRALFRGRVLAQCCHARARGGGGGGVRAAYPRHVLAVRGLDLRRHRPCGAVWHRCPAPPPAPRPLELVTVPMGPDGVSPVFTVTLSRRAGRSGRKTTSPAGTLVP